VKRKEKKRMLGSKVKLFSQVMEEVYGSYNPSSNSSWKPKPYKEGKGRYLWTDAFGVCNFLTLFHHTQDQRFIYQAESLINEVHEVLGRDRNSKERLGKATDSEPLLGGLRIGKEDPEGEEDGDGQYFHYLTKWMFALNRMSIIKGDQKYNNWAISLAKSVHPYFVYIKDPKSKRLGMRWKMSIDLSYPHVPSEGNLDPFDGFVTYRLLAEASKDPNVLEKEINDMKSMVMAKYSHYQSFDALDLGEALWLSHWYPNEQWSLEVAKKSTLCLEVLWESGYFFKRSNHRLAFREFGTTIGVQVNSFAAQDGRWMERVNKLNDEWKENLFSRDKDITPVMYCTSLIPGVFDKVVLSSSSSSSENK